MPVRAHAKHPCAITGLGQPVRISLHGAIMQTGHRNHCTDEKDWYNRFLILAHDFVRTIRFFLLNRGPFSQHQPAQHYAVDAGVSDKVFSHKVLVRMSRMVSLRESGWSSEDQHLIDVSKRRIQD
jgi:hypothetical protein